MPAALGTCSSALEEMGSRGALETPVLFSFVNGPLKLGDERLVEDLIPSCVRAPANTMHAREDIEK